MKFDPPEIVRAGAFVSIDGAGRLRVERGYVRPEDETPAETVADTSSAHEQGPQARSEPEVDAQPNSASQEEDEGLRRVFSKR